MKLIRLGLGRIMAVMKKNGVLKRLLLTILGVAVLAVAGFAIIIVILTITEFKPEQTESIAVEGTSSEVIKPGDSIDIISWNIGYGGLDKTADFFMDGGTHVNANSKEEILDNMQAVANELEDVNPDIVFLQEVDLNSRRSFHVDEQDYLMDALTGYESTFAYNYKVLYVPYPIPNIGTVNCGLVSLSKYDVTEASREALPCPFGWPSRVGNLKRCLLINRVPIEGSDKELVLVNLHLEAYDSGEGKVAQTKQLIEVLQSETAKGNYVIAAGDFNQTFSNVDTSIVPKVSDEMWVPGAIEVSDFGSEFSLLMDETKPSCRSLDKAYEGADKSNFQYYIIDGFIVSNNLNIENMETINLDFENADHNPVSLKVTLPNN